VVQEARLSNWKMNIIQCDQLLCAVMCVDDKDDHCLTDPIPDIKPECAKVAPSDGADSLWLYGF
jgi:hypothetical protein